jgi:O-acetyl-ADP-ribose deacetylase (regulator of RNase III)
MGRGIALQFKKAFPANFRAYKAACDHGEVVPGKMFVTERAALDRPRFIINFPTKRHWRGRSRMEDIETGLDDLVRVIRDRGITSIAVPPLGAGLGGLPWPDVRERVEAALKPLNIAVVVFEPAGAPDADVMARTTAAPDMTPGRAVLVRMIERYLQGLMDPFASLLEVQKLMYFTQEAGQDLRLRYKKALYGPYAENLRHVMNAVEGHLVTGYADGGDRPDKEIALVPGAAVEAGRFLSEDTPTAERVDRVGRLVDGFETPYGLELLATVHWVAHREGANDTNAATAAVHSWNKRKRQFTARQIGIAFDRLKVEGWLPLPTDTQGITQRSDP